MDITELLNFSVENKASDLHLSAGLPPMIRVDGDIRKLNVPPLDHKAVHALIYDIMNDTQRRDYEEFLEIDFSFELALILPPWHRLTDVRQSIYSDLPHLSLHRLK